MRTRTLLAFTVAVGLCAAAPAWAAKSGYTTVNGLKMYYEIHGRGRPLVLLHGAYMSIDSMGGVLQPLAKTRQVIAMELQGHGRTADIDRPIRYEQMADDVAALMRVTGTEQADVLGYSMGGGVALQLAIRHPQRVRKLVVASAGYRFDSMYPQVIELIATITPEMFAGSPFEAEYMRLAPRPQDWPRFIEKLKELDATPFAWPEAQIRAIKAPTFLIFGDYDILQLEHIVSLFKLRGGGVPGDMGSPLPEARLAVLPGTSHVGVIGQFAQIAAMVEPFLDAPLPMAQ